MRLSVSAVLLVVGSFGLSGCSKPYAEGPTVDHFNGKLTADGKPVSFPPGETVILQVVLHQTGRSFGIPIQPDGTFKIGWMPIGKYSLLLTRGPKGARGTPGRYNVPTVLTIEDGKADYAIDLGKGYKP